MNPLAVSYDWGLHRVRQVKSIYNDIKMGVTHMVFSRHKEKFVISLTAWLHNKFEMILF